LTVSPLDITKDFLNKLKITVETQDIIINKLKELPSEKQWSFNIKIIEVFKQRDTLKAPLKISKEDSLKLTLLKNLLDKDLSQISDIIKTMIDSDSLVPAVYYQTQGIDSIPLKMNINNDIKYELIPKTKSSLRRFVPGNFISYGEKVLLKVNTGEIKIDRKTKKKYFDLTNHYEQSIKLKIKRVEKDIIYLEPMSIELLQVSEDLVSLAGLSHSKNPRICSHCLNILDGYELKTFSEKFTGAKVYLCPICTEKGNSNQYIHYNYLFESTGVPKTFPNLKLLITFPDEKSPEKSFILSDIFRNIGLISFEYFSNASVDYFVDSVYRSSSLEYIFPKFIEINGEKKYLFHPYMISKNRLSGLNPIYFYYRDPHTNTYKEAVLTYQISATDALNIRINKNRLELHSIEFPRSIVLSQIISLLRNKIMDKFNLEPYKSAKVISLLINYVLLSGFFVEEKIDELNFVSKCIPHLLKEFVILEDILKGKINDLDKIEKKSAELFSELLNDVEQANTISSFISKLQNEYLEFGEKKISKKFFFSLLVTGFFDKNLQIKIIGRKYELTVTKILSYLDEHFIDFLEYKQHLLNSYTHSINHLLYSLGCEIASCKYEDLAYYENENSLCLAESIVGGMGYINTIFRNWKSSVDNKGRHVQGVSSQLIESILNCDNFTANFLLFNAFKQESDWSIVNYKTENERNQLIDKILKNYLPENFTQISRIKTLMDVIYFYLHMLVSNRISSFYWILSNRLGHVYEDLAIINEGIGYFYLAALYLSNKDQRIEISKILFRKQDINLTDIVTLNKALNSFKALMETCVTGCPDCVELPFAVCNKMHKQGNYINRYLLSQVFLRNNKNNIIRINKNSVVRNIIGEIVNKKSVIICAPLEEYLSDSIAIFDQIRSDIQQQFKDGLSRIHEEPNSPFFFINNKQLFVGFLFLDFIQIGDLDDNTL